MAVKGAIDHRYLLWLSAKNRATRVGLPFNISPADIVIPETCPVLGIPMRRGTKTQTPNSPSVDRLIPERGYVIGNIGVISSKANTIKGSASASELRAVADYVEMRICLAKLKENSGS